MAALSEEQMHELLEQPTTVELDTDPWRHGRRVTYKVEVDSKPFLTTVSMHHEEGMQDWTELVPAKMVIKQIETWVRA